MFVLCLASFVRFVVLADQLNELRFRTNLLVAEVLVIFKLAAGSLAVSKLGTCRRLGIGDIFTA